MENYFGKSAACYGQTKVAKLLLNPAIRRHLFDIKKENQRLLDVACGQGILYPISKECGFEYVGFDASPDQIRIAKELYPAVDFRVADATSFEFESIFDVITVSMLLPMVGSRDEIRAILTNCSKHLDPDGTILISVTHPCFDHYMRHGVLGLKNINTSFDGYFASGTEFKFENPTANGTFSFDDFHWTIADYVGDIRSAGFSIDKIDECRPGNECQNDEAFWNRRNAYPTFMVFCCRKSNLA